MTTGHTHTPWRVLARLLGAQRRVLLAGIMGGLAWQAAGVTVPVILGWIIESGIRGEDRRVLWWGAVAIVSVGVVEAIGAAVRHRSACTADEQGRAGLRDALVAAVVADERGPASELSPGELIGRATGDVDELGGFLDSVAHTVAYALTVPVVVLVLAIVDWPLALVVGLMIPTLILVMWRYSAVWQVRSAEVRRSFDSLTTAGEEMIEGFRVTSGLGIGAEMADRYGRRSGELRRVSVRRARLWLAFEPVVEGLSMVAVTVVLWLGGNRVIDGHLSVGGLVTAVGLALFLTWPVRTLGERIVTIQTALASAARLADLLHQPPISSSLDPAAPPTGSHSPAGVAVRGVTIERSGRPVVVAADFELSPGSFVRLSGPTGSGKSSLLQAIAGDLDPVAGTVELGGRPVADWPARARHRAVVTVGPAPFLFTGTIADNVRFGAPDCDDGAVWAALALADALEVVDELPEGVVTVLGERGVTLSGGQRQRVALARALIADPDVLLLDGALSAVDPGREVHILAAIREARRHRLTVVVSTNPDLDHLVDLVDVHFELLPSGAVQEIG